jgi:hypothetical protein
VSGGEFVKTQLASNASVYTLAKKPVRESPETPNGFCKTGCAPMELLLLFQHYYAVIALTRYQYRIIL